jgi:hypothetical protein
MCSTGLQRNWSRPPIMKLAKVDHYRCGQPAGKWGLTSYVWIPDEMSEHEFGLLCSAARDKYLENEHEWKKSTPPYVPAVDKYPDTWTLSDVRADQKKHETTYEAHMQKQREARKSFVELLTEVSNGAIKKFWTEEPAVKHEVDWGHQHGVTIDMGETKLGDWPSTEEEDYV